VQDQEGIKRSMQLKDAMRETCLSDLAEAWYNLLTAYQSANPDLAAAVLNTVERYVNWIDVALVVNERWALQQSINQLTACLGGPSEESQTTAESSQSMHEQVINAVPRPQKSPSRCCDVWSHVCVVNHV